MIKGAPESRAHPAHIRFRSPGGFMRHPARRTAFRFVTASAALGLIAAMTGGPAAARSQDDTVTPPGAAAGGEVVPMNYAVNAFETRDGDWGERSYQKSTRAVKHAVKAEGGDILRSFPKIGVVIARATEASFVDAMRSAQYEDIVESIGATRTSPTTIPNDDGRLGQDLLRSPLIEPEPMEDDQWGNTELNSLEANEIEDGSQDVLVGNLDSGMQFDHPDLVVDAENSVDCTNNGIEETDPSQWQPTNGTHGTHTGGTIAAQRNGIGVAGIAPGVRIASVKVVNPDGFIFPEYAICGFMWATHHNMDVTNNSYYIDPWMYWCPDDEDQGAVLEAVGRALDWSTRQGVLNVASAGNASQDLANKTTDSSSPNDSEKIPDRPVEGCFDIPTEHDGVVTVSSTTEAGPKSSFSNYGFEVIDVSAPGSNILSTVTGSSYGYLSGTSMAGPHVVGVAALIKSAHPDFTPAQIVELLESSAEDRDCGGATGCVGDAEYNGFFGHGVVDALAAVS
jgi:subtilisin family serine protease